LGAPASGGKEGKKQGVLWVPEGALVRPVKVAVGLSDGSLTQVTAAALKEGTPVVVGEIEKQAGQSGKAAPGASPFTPQLFRRGASGASGGSGGGGGPSHGR
jgi:hypothetical protein